MDERRKVEDSLDCDVAVIGLGPVGGVLCNLLSGLGLRVIAFDREPGVLQMPRGVGIDGEIMRVVQTVGLAEELAPYLKVFRGAQYLDAGGNVVSTRPGISGPGPQGWPNRYNVHQPEFEEVLRNGIHRSPGVEVRARHEVQEVHDGVHAATTVAQNLETGALVTVRSRFVVGCDGGRSVVRRCAGIDLEDFGLNEPWIVADFKVTEQADLPAINTHYADPQGPVIYIHVVRDLRRFEFKALPDEDLEAAVLPAALWARVSRWLHPAEAELVRSAVYTHRSLLARSWRRGRLLLAGDAAHQTPPFLGQGLCTGVRDAASLAWRLGAVIRNGASAELLDSYEKERSEHARFFIQTSTSLGSILSSPQREKLDELNLRVGREGRGTAPRLGAGLFAEDNVGGTLAPQPRLDSGALLDDAVGYRFAVVVDAALLRQLPVPMLDLLAAADFAVVEATAGAAEWLAALRARAVIIRPDRYYYGQFDDAGMLEDALRLLVSRTGPEADIEPMVGTAHGA